MARRFSLAHLTVLDLAPPKMVVVAARCGYATVGLRLLAATDASVGYPLMRDPPMLRATRAAIAATGVGVLDIELVRITPEIDVAAMEPVLAAGAELGARHMICAPYDPDPSRLTDRLSAIGALARSHGIGAVLEFFPWTEVPDLETCVEIADAADAGLLVDTLHFNRSGSRLDTLRALDPARLPYAHVADAPVCPPYSIEALLHAGRAERLPPGEGAIDIRSIVDALPTGIPLALEVPMTAWGREVGSEAVARRVWQAATRLLD